MYGKYVYIAFYSLWIVKDLINIDSWEDHNIRESTPYVVAEQQNTQPRP